MTTKIGINGFGGIGRLGLAGKVAVVNYLTDPKIRTHLLKYDTNYGTCPFKVEISKDHRGGLLIRFFLSGVLRVSDTKWYVARRLHHTVVDGKAARIVLTEDNQLNKKPGRNLKIVSRLRSMWEGRHLVREVLKLPYFGAIHTGWCPFGTP